MSCTCRTAYWNPCSHCYFSGGIYLTKKEERGVKKIFKGKYNEVSEVILRRIAEKVPTHKPGIERYLNGLQSARLPS